jgi:peptide/nickel transport system permease protein
LILVTIIVFLSVRFIPGGIIDLMLSEIQLDYFEETEATVDALKHVMGLDEPVHVQYGRWLASAVRGDLGESLWTSRSVTSDILRSLPVSLELGLIAIISALLIALPVGVFSAVRQDTWADYVGRTIAILATSLPSFWVGTMVIVYPSKYLGWSPNVEYIPFFSNPAGNLLQFVVPAIVMGMVMSGTTMRMTRTMMLEVLRQDYIRTAWSKGLRERTVIVRHALKNALMPVVTIVAMMLPILIGGSVIMEQIFGLPGIGRLLIDAINQRDYPVISGINLVLASFILIMNLIVDITYSYLDPRIRYT